MPRYDNYVNPMDPEEACLKTNGAMSSDPLVGHKHKRGDEGQGAQVDPADIDVIVDSALAGGSSTGTLLQIICWLAKRFKVLTGKEFTDLTADKVLKAENLDTVIVKCVLNNPSQTINFPSTEPVHFTDATLEGIDTKNVFNNSTYKATPGTGVFLVTFTILKNGGSVFADLAIRKNGLIEIRGLFPGTDGSCSLTTILKLTSPTDEIHFTALPLGEGSLVINSSGTACTIIKISS
jgi:hypothetical protein